MIVTCVPLMFVGSGKLAADPVATARLLPKTETIDPGETGPEAKLAALTTPPVAIWGVCAQRFSA